MLSVVPTRTLAPTAIVGRGRGWGGASGKAHVRDGGDAQGIRDRHQRLVAPEGVRLVQVPHMMISPRPPEPGEFAIGESHDLVTREEHIKHLGRLDGLRQRKSRTALAGELTNKLISGDPQVGPWVNPKVHRRIKPKGSAETPNDLPGGVTPTHGHLNGDDVLSARLTAEVHALHLVAAPQDPGEVAGRLEPSRDGGKPVGVTVRTGGQRIDPQGGLMSTRDDTDPRGGPSRARGSRTLSATAAPRGGGTRSAGLVGPTSSPSREDGRRSRPGRTGRRGPGGLSELGQHARGRIRRALGAIQVESCMQLSRRPRVPEPGSASLAEVAPTAGSDGVVGPRPGPKLGEDKVSLVRGLDCPDPGQPDPVPPIEVRGREAGVVQISPELRDIVGGSLKDLRRDTRSHEAEGPKVTMLANPLPPGIRIFLA